MSDLSGSVTLSAPRAFKLKDVRTDLRKLFSKLAEAGLQLPLGNMGDFVSALFGAAEAVTRETPEEVAWRLIHRSLAKAVKPLVDGCFAGRPVWQGDLDRLRQKITISVDEAEVRFGLDFFENPAALPVLAAVKRDLAGWLRLFDIPEAEADSVAARLDSYFTLALHNEWRLNQAVYTPLLEHLTSPFAKAARLDQDWERNRLALIQQMDQPVFGETFSLDQVYIRLRGVYQERIKRKDTAGPRRSRQAVALEAAESEGNTETRMVAVDLHREMDHWFATASQDDAFRLIRGGPGSGKSTFARKLAAELSASRRMRVLFFPLQWFLVSGRLTEAIGEYLTDTGTFETNPLETKDFAAPNRKLLLIFDGLDELTKPGAAADVDARSFLGELRTKLNQWNAGGCRVLALVTGRTAAVQASRDALRPADRQELEVLKYYVNPEDRKKYFDPQKLLEQDQRLDWWRRYAECKRDEPREIPQRQLSRDLEELSSEPLLNYLLVLSGYHKDAPADKDVNRNAIYAKLFKGVQERKYAGAPDQVRQELKDEFEEVMEIIATAAWYGDGRTATVEDIRRCCTDGVRPSIEKFLKEQGGVVRLIAAFYFQAAEHRSKRNDAFEFTHKSFGEYLTARRLVRQIDRMHRYLTTNPDLYDERRALAEWFKLCSQQPMDFDVLRFLRDEIRMPGRQDHVAGWQQTLVGLVNRTLREGMPALESALGTFRNAEAKARNAEETLFAALNACAHVTGHISDVDWGGPTGAGAMLNRLRGQRNWQVAWARSIILDCLGQTRMTGQMLFAHDLILAHLAGANLARAILARAHLAGAHLAGAHLAGATLERATRGGADLANIIIVG